MNVLLAAIIFTFFAVFAPTSHGDRPLLHADHKNGEIQYSDFKLPLARLQSHVTVEKTFSFLFLSSYFIAVIPPAINEFTFLKKSFVQKDKLLSFHTSPFVFCEILQV